MYREDTWRIVQRMDAQGISKAAIARELGMSRNTVRRLLSIPGAPRTTVSEQDTIDESLLILVRIPLGLVPRQQPLHARRSRNVGLTERCLNQGSVRKSKLPPPRRIPALVCAALILSLGSMPATGETEDGVATLVVEIDPETPRVGEEVGFFFRYRDPDPFATVVLRAIDYGDGGREVIESYPLACTSPAGWLWDEATASVPRDLRAPLGWYHFVHRYEVAGTFEIHAVAESIRSVCPLIDELDRAEVRLTITVQ